MVEKLSSPHENRKIVHIFPCPLQFLCHTKEWVFEIWWHDFSCNSGENGQVEIEQIYLLSKIFLFKIQFIWSLLQNPFCLSVREEVKSSTPETSRGASPVATSSPSAWRTTPGSRTTASRLKTVQKMSTQRVKMTRPTKWSERFSRKIKEMSKFLKILA